MAFRDGGGLRPPPPPPSPRSQGGRGGVAPSRGDGEGAASVAAAMRALLLKFSNSPGLARWVTSHKTTRRMSQRFVAGESLDEAVAAARVCNADGMKVSLDLLGESVTNAIIF